MPPFYESIPAINGRIYESPTTWRWDYMWTVSVFVSIVWIHAWLHTVGLWSYVYTVLLMFGIYLCTCTTYSRCKVTSISCPFSLNLGQFWGILCVGAPMSCRPEPSVSWSRGRWSSSRKPNIFFKAHGLTIKEERAKGSHRAKPSIIPHVLQLSAVNSLAFAPPESERVHWTRLQASIRLTGIFVNDPATMCFLQDSQDSSRENKPLQNFKFKNLIWHVLLFTFGLQSFTPLWYFAFSEYSTGLWTMHVGTMRQDGGRLSSSCCNGRVRNVALIWMCRPFLPHGEEVRGRFAACHIA